MNLKKAVLGANKAVQESSVFKFGKEIFYEDGLRASSRSDALSSMEKKVTDTYNDSHKYYVKDKNWDSANDLSKAREQYLGQAKANINDANGASAEAWADMSAADQNRLRGVAAGRATVAYGAPETNADLALKKYSKALNASRRELNAKTGIGMAKGYFVDPFKDGRIGTGVARAGVAAAGVATVGSVTYSLTGGGSPDYSANYSSSSGDTQDF
jgi:hypothetical protein